MPKDLVAADLKTVLSKKGGTYVLSYDEFVAEQEARAIARQPRSTIESRKEAWKRAVAKLDRHMMARANKILSGYVKKVRFNSVITSAEPHVLEESEAFDLMGEYLDLKTIEEFVKARYEEIRQTVFGSMTEELAKEGEEFPEHVNHAIEVEDLGQKFCREATGRLDPQLDEERLAELLGEDRWLEVTTEEEIPATVVTRLDYDKLMGLVRREPAVMEMLRPTDEGGALIVGDWKKPRLMVREIKKG